MIPYGKQEITQEDIQSVVKVLQSEYITQGSVVPEFEKRLCEYTGAKHATVTNSATASLHIACLALGLSNEDVVWTSPITFIASANCARYCGAKVDFVDIEIDTALMCVESLKIKLEDAKKKGKLPKIVIVVHFAGQSCDMREIFYLSKKNNFKIIEDAAHSIGAKYDNEPVGNCKYSDITVFSFHPVKIITTGEGGAALSNKPYLDKKMKILREHGIVRDRDHMISDNENQWYYEQQFLGFNYRMTDIHASLGISQLKRLEGYVLKRQELAKLYDREFKKIDYIKPLICKSNHFSSYHLYVIRVCKGIGVRDKLFSLLRKRGIGVNLHYIPVYLQPFYQEKGFKRGYCPEAEKYYSEVLSIPIHASLNEDELDRVISSLVEVLR